MATSSVNSQHL